MSLRPSLSHKYQTWEGIFYRFERSSLLRQGVNEFEKSFTSFDKDHRSLRSKGSTHRGVNLTRGALLKGKAQHS
jgi:hypothetical protein